MLCLRNLAIVALLLRVEAGPVEKRFSLGRKANPLYPLDEVDQLEEASLGKVEAYLAKHPSKTGCTLENAARRVEWLDMSDGEKIDYIKAVRCLQQKPPKSPRDKIPGALNRYDDFVATHMTLAGTLHSTPHLLPAHRLYIWAFEKALREECGYTGYQPYWNWDRTATDPITSPLFNGNETSMGGNGGPAEYPGVIMGGFPKPYEKIPPAGGGGCVTEGPFKDMVVSLGPKGTVLKDVPKNPRSDGLGSNPRCLRRDVNKFSAAVTTANYTHALITETANIDDFQRVLLGNPKTGDWGVHAGGHYTIGGDPGGDFFSSPGDPLFWFHHGMIDRIWWIWQMQDPENRMDKVPGAPPVDPNDPGKGAFADDVVDLTWTAEAVPLLELLDNLGGYGGEFCYIYV